jgi:hypothetical protein
MLKDSLLFAMSEAEVAAALRVRMQRLAEQSPSGLSPDELSALRREAAQLRRRYLYLRGGGRFVEETDPA